MELTCGSKGELEEGDYSIFYNPTPEVITDTNRLLTGSKPYKLDYSELTYEKMVKAFMDIFNNREKNTEDKPFVIEYWAGEYSCFNDEEFTAFVSSPSVKFIGGEDSIARLKNRCIKLNIPLDNSKK